MLGTDGLWETVDTAEARRSREIAEIAVGDGGHGRGEEEKRAGVPRERL